MDPAQQMSRFGVLIEKLAEFPDRDLIYQIWQSAKLGLEIGQIELAKEMSGMMLDKLTEASLPAGRRVPLLYALDAIAKNVGGAYLLLFSERLREAFETSFSAVSDKDKTRMHHVLRTWNDKKYFLEHLDDLNGLVAPWHTAFVAAQHSKQQPAERAPMPVAQPRPKYQPPPPKVQPVPVEPVAPKVQPVPVEPAYVPKPPVPVEPRRKKKKPHQTPLAVALPGQLRPAVDDPPSRRQNGHKQTQGQKVPKRAREQYQQGNHTAAAPFDHPFGAAGAPLSLTNSFGLDREPPELVARARRDLRAHLADLGTDANSMTLEEVARDLPDLYAQLVERARESLAQAADPPDQWPGAAPPGREAGADEGAVAAYAADLAELLEARTLRAARGEAPASLRPALADQAAFMAGHLRTLLAGCGSTESRAVDAAHRVIAEAQALSAVTGTEIDNPLEGKNEDLACHELALRANRAVPCLSARGLSFASQQQHQRRGLLGLAELAEAAVDPEGLAALYDARQHVSRSDGLRFDSAAELRAHAESIRLRAASPKLAASRVWGPTRRQFCVDHLVDLDRQLDTVRADARRHAAQRAALLADDRLAGNADDNAAVPAPPDGAARACRVCGDTFDVVYQGDDFVLKDAVLVPVDDGQRIPVHARCRDATCGIGGTLPADQLLDDLEPSPGGTKSNISDPPPGGPVDGQAGPSSVVEENSPEDLDDFI